MEKHEIIKRTDKEDYRLWINTENKKGKIILVQPFLWEARVKNRTKFTESLALGYLAGALMKANFSVASINSEMSKLNAEETVKGILHHEDVFLIGISCKSERAYRDAKEIASGIKKHRKDVHITLGGLLATVADKIILDDCEDFDSVSRGEGEYLITELAYKLLYNYPLNDIKSLTYRKEGAIVQNPSVKRIQNLDILPMPFRNEMDEIKRNNHKQLTSAYMVSSRGCFAACTFCSIHQLYGGTSIIRRSPQNIIDEMKDIYCKYGIARFSFVDDQFITPSKKGLQWLEEFCDLLENEELKVKFYLELRADTIRKEIIDRLVNNGLHRLFVGIESGSDTVLRRWKKGCTVQQNKNALFELEKSGLKKFQVNFGYIMFDPLMTYNELKENYYWLKKSGFCKVQHLQNKMNIYFGTPAYNIMVNEYKMIPPAFGDRWKYEFNDKSVGFVEEVLRKIHLKLQDEMLDSYISALERYREAIGFGEDLDDIQDSGDERDIIEAINSIYRYINGLEREIYFNIFESCFDFIENVYEQTYVDFVSEITEISFLKAEKLNRISVYFVSILDMHEKDELAVIQSGKLIKMTDGKKFLFDVFIDIPINDRFDCQVKLYEYKQ